jgi:hypothetical protein
MRVVNKLFALIEVAGYTSGAPKGTLYIVTFY